MTKDVETRVKGFFGSVAADLEGVAGKPTSTTIGSDPDSDVLDDVGAALKELALRTERAGFAMGYIKMVGLEAIREAMGKGFERTADIINAVAETEIARVFGADSLMTAQDSEIVFVVDGDFEAAKRAIYKLASDIRSSLYRRLPEYFGTLNIEEYTHAFDTSAQDMPRTAECLLEVMRENAPTTAEREIIMFANSVASRDIHYLPLSPTGNEGALHRADILFDHPKLKKMEMMPDEEKAQLRSIIDMEILNQVIRHKFASNGKIGRGRKSAILIPVRYSTMIDFQTAFRYFKLVEKAKSTFDAVLFEITHIPAGRDAVVALHSQRVLAAFKDLGVKVVLRAERFDFSEIYPVINHIDGVSIIFDRSHSRQPAVVQRLFRYAKATGVPVVAYGANSIGLAQLARANDVDWVGGTAVQRAIETVRPVKPRNV